MGFLLTSSHMGFTERFHNAPKIKPRLVGDNVWNLTLKRELRHSCHKWFFRAEQRPGTVGDASLSAPRTPGHVVSTQLVINNLIPTHLLKLCRCAVWFKCDCVRVGALYIMDLILQSPKRGKIRSLICPLLQGVVNSAKRVSYRPGNKHLLTAY